MPKSNGETVGIVDRWGYRRVTGCDSREHAGKELEHYVLQLRRLNLHHRFRVKIRYNHAIHQWEVVCREVRHTA